VFLPLRAATPTDTTTPTTQTTTSDHHDIDKYADGHERLE
jgi:hypothetical protein